MISNHEEMDQELVKLQIDLLLQAIYAWYGYDFRGYSYNMIKRRILYRVTVEGLSSISCLQEMILYNQACFHRLLSDFSINVTEMFRNPTFFLDFRENIVPLLRTYPRIRIWHAGCSTGEEVFSMAILLQEEGLYDRTKIYATDINVNVLETAKAGLFPIEEMKKYTNNYRKAGGKEAFSDYYTVIHNKVKFHDHLAKNIVFAQHNLVTDGSFNEFHVILCRNVLIYFSKELREKVHQLFNQSLGMFGILGLGDKESIKFTCVSDIYEEVVVGQKLYKKLK